MKLILRIETEKGLEPILKEFGAGVYRVGRSEFSDLVLDGKDISRSHLEIRVTDSSVYVTNMSSTGHVKLNGERVETGEVRDGDRVQLGAHVLLFQMELDAVAETPIDSVPSSEPEPFLEAQSEPPQDPAPEMQQQVAEVREFPLMERYGADSSQVEGALALKTENTDLESQAVVAKLIFTEGPLAGTEIPVQGYEMTMGRSKKADIYIPDDKLSRKHAKISRVGQGYRLIDLDSRNGTYVNGVRVLEHPLNSFDVVELGKSKIKFLILDLEMGGLEKGGPLKVFDGGAQTKSVQLVAEPEPLREPTPNDVPAQEEVPVKKSRFRKNAILGGAVLILLLVLLALPKGEDSEQSTQTPAPQESQESPKQGPVDANLAPAVPREFSDLTPEAQRKVEGHYNNALRFQAKEEFESAYTEIKDLHTMIPYYKESKKLEAFLLKKIKEKQKEEATEKANRDRYAELQIYLEDGLEYLKQGDFARAEEAFNNVLVLDPKNATAAKGVRAAQLQIRDIEQLPPEVDPEMEKRKLVVQLMEQAALKYEEKSYQEAINLAEKVRTIELKGETEYLNQAKQLIDKARLQQKEEFEPFLIQAKEKFAEGDYNLSRDLCDEMLRRDKSYEAAQECSLRARKQLNRLAKEAYTHGYILESMNRIEEAKQYWNRAKNYARPGDPYYEKIQRKLDNYQ
ncbi:MAG: FHA domain-containing protein [Proteobacteria bacterium]|nr:FHA domain-containing protein [Pseudomonadota bacterium]